MTISEIWAPRSVILSGRTGGRDNGRLNVWVTSNLGSNATLLSCGRLEYSNYLHSTHFWMKWRQSLRTHWHIHAALVSFPLPSPLPPSFQSLSSPSLYVCVRVCTCARTWGNRLLRNQENVVSLWHVSKYRYLTDTRRCVTYEVLNEIFNATCTEL